MGHDVSAEDAREALATLTNHHHPEGARVKRRATQTIEAYIADHEGEDYTFERDVLPGRAAEEAAREGPPEDEDPNATPAAIELAEEHDLDVEEIEGTGEDGRVLKGDVEDAVAELEGDDEEEDAATDAEGEEDEPESDEDEGDEEDSDEEE